MVRKLILCLLALLLTCSLASAENRVFDQANLFSRQEIQEMEAWIERIQTTYQMDAIILTSHNAPYDADLEHFNESLDYADLFYERGGFGLGDDDAGLIYFIDMSNRVPTISTTGVMIDYITDHRLETLLDLAWEELYEGRYGESAMAVLEKLERYLRQGREDGSFRYDAETGRRLSGLYNELTGSEILTAALIALAAAVIFILCVNHSYSIKGTAWRYDLSVYADRKLLIDNEQFLRQHVRRVRRAESSGGGGRGSSVHRSSSGRSHGGGSGRRF